MNAQPHVKRPTSFDLDRRYWLMVSPETQSEVVVFVTYDACPAFVIVRDINGRRLRCPRENLFSSSNGNQVLNERAPEAVNSMPRAPITR